MKKTLIIVCLAGMYTSAQAQTEYVLNAHRDSSQRDVRLGIDQAGTIYAVWKSIRQVNDSSRGDIVLRKFDTLGIPLTPEIIVPERSADDQERPALAVHPNGTAIVAYASLHLPDTMYDVHARWFPAVGSPSSEVRVNTTTTATQSWPAIAVAPSGESVIAWESWDQDGGDRGIYARRFDAAGTAISAEFRLNQTTAYSQARPALAYLPNGQFVAVWESWGQDGGTPVGYGVVMRIFNGDGTPASNETLVNTFTADHQWQADVAVLEDTSIVVTWCSWQQDGGEGGIYLRRFASNGSPLIGEIAVNRSTAYYQWLPKITALPGGGYAVIWSSWKQDRSREGVYVQFFDRLGKKTSFEMPVNVTTESFQWEPALVGITHDAVWTAWSHWNGVGDDYDVLGRPVRSVGPETFIHSSTIARPSGTSTSSILVHVVDSLALTGDTYELLVDSVVATRTYLRLQDVTTGATSVPSYVIDRGEGVLYLLPTVDGFAVEVVPELQFDLDYAASRFASHSATNVEFAVQKPTAGTPLLAPIDIVLIWGSTDTLATGEYVAPVDSAINVSGQQVVKVPFRAWNLTDNAPVGLWVPELTTGNKKWDVGERIIFRTPIPYRTAANNSHAQLQPNIPAAPIVLPQPGDTNYILTTRPLTAQDRFRFQTDRSFLAGIRRTSDAVPAEFGLLQNFPNPFNPTTVISYQVSVISGVNLKVYDILGREMATLVNERQAPGTYQVQFDGTRLASGVYVVRLEANTFRSAIRMILLK